LEPIIGNVVISEVEALTCAVLSKAEKTLALWGSIFVTECVTL